MAASFLWGQSFYVGRRRGPKLGTPLAIHSPDKDPLDTNPVNSLRFSQKEAVMYDRVSVEEDVQDG